MVLRKCGAAALALGVLLTPRLSKADMFGGDLVILASILSNAVQQLTQLRQMLSTGKDSLNLLNDINRGLNDALGTIQSSGAIRDPGLFQELKRAQEGLRYFQDVYGKPVDSSETRVQQHADQSVAEAVALNNAMYDYAKELDKIGERIKSQSNMASPKGAQKLTAQSLGVMVQMLNQSLRAQATSLKLQAQSMAIQNRKDKQHSEQVQKTSQKLNAAMAATRPEFKYPRF